MTWNQLEFRYHENIIYFIIPILIIALLILAYRKKDRILKSINLKVKSRYRVSGFAMIILGIVLIAFSLLGPQVFKGYREIKKEGLDIYILLDISNSMLVEDTESSRLELARNVVNRILDNLKGDRVGFIPFSSDAYIQMPLTDDYHLARMFLNVVDTDMVAGGGTDIAVAINLAADSFQRSAQGDKVILIISDGEEHDSGESLAAVKAINDKDIRVFTIGIGTKKGGTIPIFNAQGIKEGYRKDRQGKYIVSHLDSTVLKELAEAGQGNYVQFALGQEIGLLINEISSLKRNQIKIEKVKKFTQIYQYFLGLGILFFLLGYLLLERRKKQ